MSSWSHIPGVACSGPGVQKGPRKGPAWPEVENAVKPVKMLQQQQSGPASLPNCMMVHWHPFSSIQFSRVQLWDPMDRSTPGLLSITNSRSSLKLMSTDSWVSPTPRYISGKNRNTNSKRYIHPSGHSSIIYNSQDMKATQAPVARWLD